MASLAALLLLTSAPAPAATPPPAPPPALSVSAVGIARARILRPVEVTRTGQMANDRAAPLVTHASPRRDGALVVDCY